MNVWVVEGEVARPVAVDQLASDQAYLIPDQNRRKIYLWAGKDCPKPQVYAAGVVATKFKSAEHLYGFEITRVEEGDEPEGFACICTPPSGQVAENNAITEVISGVDPIETPAGESDLFPQVFAEITVIKQYLEMIGGKIDSKLTTPDVPLPRAAIAKLPRVLSDERHVGDPNFIHVVVECQSCGGTILMPVPKAVVLDSDTPTVPVTYVHGLAGNRHAITVELDHEFEVRRAKVTAISDDMPYP